jgi:hypothetical protein
MRTDACGKCSPIVLALTIAASPALAQTGTAQGPQASKRSDVEVTSFVSIGSRASSRIGSAVTFPVTSNLSGEAELGYRRGESEINAPVRA